MVDKYITDLTDVTYTNVLDTTSVEIQRAASATQTERMTLDDLRQWITGIPPYLSGRYYHMHPGTTLQDGAGPLITNTARGVPFFIRAPVTITALVIRITTASAGGNVQMAIYANDPADNTPYGSELAKTSSQSTTSTGPFELTPTGGNFTLLPGIYWLLFNADNSTVRLSQYNGSRVETSGLVGATSVANGWVTGSVPLLHIYTALTFGTWGDLTSASWTYAPNDNSHGTAMFKVA